MKNNVTRTIHSEEITIDVRIWAAVRSTSQPLPRIWN